MKNSLIIAFFLSFSHIISSQSSISIAGTWRFSMDANDKGISEKWFSPELQILVMSRHLDPIAGEHVFKLVNIRRIDPSVDLFTIPVGFRIENQPNRAPER